MKKSIKKIVVSVLIICLMFTFSGCFGGTVEDDYKDNNEHVTLKMIAPVISMPQQKQIQDINRELNKITKDKINASVVIETIMQSEIAGQVTTRVGVGESLDLVYTNAQTYYTLTESDSLFPVDKILHYTPDLKAEFNDNIWNQLRYRDGKIYAVPNNQILPRTASFSFRDETLFVEYMSTKITSDFPDNFDQQEKVINDYLTELPLKAKFDLVKDYLKYCKDNQKGFGGKTYGIYTNYYMETFLGYEDFGLGQGVPGVVAVNGNSNDKITVVNQFETEEFSTMINAVKEWYSEGYIPETITEGQYDNTNLDVSPIGTWKPGERMMRLEGDTKKYETRFKFGDSVYLQSYIMGTMYSIPRSSSNPARAIKFIELMHTDPDIHNLLKYGIEGKHYEKVNDGKQVKLLGRSGYNMNIPSWAIGNELIGLPLEYQNVDLYKQIEQINKDTPMSPLIGFVFDRKPVETEIKNCSAISTRYLNRFDHGIDLAKDPDLLKDFIKELDNAGSQKIITEKQKQIDEFLSNKNK